MLFLNKNINTKSLFNFISYLFNSWWTLNLHVFRYVLLKQLKTTMRLKDVDIIIMDSKGPHIVVDVYVATSDRAYLMHTLYICLVHSKILCIFFICNYQVRKIGGNTSFNFTLFVEVVLIIDPICIISEVYHSQNTYIGYIFLVRDFNLVYFRNIFPA